jgi:hypothetical protein
VLLLPSPKAGEGLGVRVFNGVLDNFVSLKTDGLTEIYQTARFLSMLYKNQVELCN